MKNITITELLSKYNDEDKARTLFEEWRWNNEPTCPRCGTIQKSKITPHSEKGRARVRAGLYFCSDCRKPFTVTMGTIMESTHIPLHKWLGAFFLMSSSKNGISSLEMQRLLGVTYKTAWFLTHRIRFAIDESESGELLQGTVEIDETYVGGKPRKGEPRKDGRGTQKTPVVALIERQGKVRTRIVPNASLNSLEPVVIANVDPEGKIYTDEWTAYKSICKRSGRKHETVVHSRGEYSRGEIHVNNCESFFATIKRSIVGTFHNISKQHTSRYVNEFAFRWNNRKISDGERMQVAFSQIEGKRLFYKEPKV